MYIPLAQILYIHRRIIIYVHAHFRCPPLSLPSHCVPSFLFRRNIRFLYTAGDGYPLIWYIIFLFINRFHQPRCSHSRQIFRHLVTFEPYPVSKRKTMIDSKYYLDPEYIHFGVFEEYVTFQYIPHYSF